MSDYDTGEHPFDYDVDDEGDAIEPADSHPEAVFDAGGRLKVARSEGDGPSADSADDDASDDQDEDEPTSLDALDAAETQTLTTTDRPGRTLAEAERAWRELASARALPRGHTPSHGRKRTKTGAQRGMGKRVGRAPATHIDTEWVLIGVLGPERVETLAKSWRRRGRRSAAEREVRLFLGFLLDNLSVRTEVRQDVAKALGAETRHITDLRNAYAREPFSVEWVRAGEAVADALKTYVQQLHTEPGSPVVPPRPKHRKRRSGAKSR